MSSSILSKIRWPRPFAGLRGITLADVPREVSAGVTLAALMIPLNISYAQVAGVPPAARFQELTSAEKARLIVWIDWTQQHLASHLTPTPDAFNLGLNDGPAAGQTMLQLHFHIIPRYTGDVPDPRGGIRHIIPSKARYWQ